MYRVFRNPVETDQEGDSLLKICQQEVVNEDNVLVIANVSGIVFSPEEQTICDETQQTQNRNYGYDGEDSNRDEAIPLNSWQRIDNNRSGRTARRQGAAGGLAAAQQHYRADQIHHGDTFLDGLGFPTSILLCQ